MRRTLTVVLLGACAFLAAYVAFRLKDRPATALVADSASGAASSAAAGSGAGASPGALAPAAAQTAAQPGAEQSAATAGSNPIPETLPDVKVPDLSGKPKSIRDFLGHPLIINFWATWCEPCRREMPLLQKLQERYRSQGLQIVGVAVDSRSAVEQYLHARPVNYAILADESAATDAMNRFGAQPVLPFSVFADSRGRIVVVKLGELHPDEAEYILATEHDLEVGHQTLPQARAAIDTKLRDLAIARAKAGGTSTDGSSAPP